MAACDSSEEEVIDEPELKVDDYLYCKISGGSNYDDYLCKKVYAKLSPEKMQEMINDPELYSQLSDSIISFLKKAKKTSVSSGGESDTSEREINNLSLSPLIQERRCSGNKDSASKISTTKKDSLLYLQLSKDRERSSMSSSCSKEGEHVVNVQPSVWHSRFTPCPQFVINKNTDANNIVAPFVEEKCSSRVQERMLLSPSSMNNNNSNIISQQPLQEPPLKYITKILPVKSIKSNIITTTTTTTNNKDFQQKHDSSLSINTDNNIKQNNNTNIFLKTFKNVPVNFLKQYHHSNADSNVTKSDMRSNHNEFNDNSKNNNSHNNNSNNNNSNNDDVSNSRRNNNEVLLTNQQLQSKLLYRHLTGGSNKIYNCGKSYLIPLSTYRNNENSTKEGNYLEPLLPLASPSLQLYATTAGGVSNIICEKNNNFTIQKATILKTTTPVKNILTQEQVQQQQEQALNTIGSGNGNNYDSIITLSFENSNDSDTNSTENYSDISGVNSYNSANNKSNIAGNLSDNDKINKKNSNSEIVIEIGDKNKLMLNSPGGSKEIMSLQSLQHQQQQQQATMVCLKRGDMHPSSPQQLQPPLFNRSHVTHIVERRLIPSNSNANKYETFIQKRLEQLVPIQPCRILGNKQIKQYCGPKSKSEKRNFSAVEPVLIPSVAQNSSLVPGGTVKGGTNMFKGISNEQMSSLQRLLKLGTTATVMSNEEKKIKLETIVKKLWAKELSEPSEALQSSPN